jgi:hypothetical protein
MSFNNDKLSSWNDFGRNFVMFFDVEDDGSNQIESEYSYLIADARQSLKDALHTPRLDQERFNYCRR